MERPRSVIPGGFKQQMHMSVHFLVRLSLDLKLDKQHRKFSVNQSDHIRKTERLKITF